LILISLAVLGGLIIWRYKPQPAPINIITTEPSPSPELTSTGQSSDGKIALTLIEKPEVDQSLWTLIVQEKKIWSKTLNNQTTLSLPFNTVSPDNQYLFLKQTDTYNTRYLILTTNGESLTKDIQILEFTSLFETKYPDLKITDATGWAAPTLIVFNTDKKKGGLGPSFWFDLSNQSFIQLSNRFN